MLGSTIDYWLLLPFTHKRNRATEEEIESRVASKQIELKHAVGRIEKLQSRLGGRLPLDPAFRYLDIGCAKGDIAIGLAELGAGHVTGVDMVPRYISMARANAERLKLSDRVHFHLADIHHWQPAERYDVVLSHEALEHIREPRSFLHALKRFLRPGGIAVLAFGPLFHSPAGDHQDGYFRIPIPWRGVLFSEKAILRLRQKQFRPTEKAATYCEITGGLNLLRYSEFLAYTKEAGWKIDFLEINPQLRRLSPAHSLSNLLCRTPVLQDYFASSIYVILRET